MSWLFGVVVFMSLCVGIMVVICMVGYVMGCLISIFILYGEVYE